VLVENTLAGYSPPLPLSANAYAQLVKIISLIQKTSAFVIAEYCMFLILTFVHSSSIVPTSSIVK